MDRYPQHCAMGCRWQPHDSHYVVMMMRWQSLTNEEREREYSPSSCIPNSNYQPFIDAYVNESESSWRQLQERSDVKTTTLRYGEASSHTIDVATPASPSSPPPLLVFIHGGYWQELSKTDSRFAAQHCIDRGWGFAAIDYTLAPLATVAEIVDECRRAVTSLHAEAAALGLDANRLFVAGSSAGAHLAAMVALGYGRSANLVRGTILVSGIYELEPLLGTSVNDALGLDVETAAATSPLRLSLEKFPTSLVAYGDNETSEFKAQSLDFAAHLAESGSAATVLEIAGRNHFDVILELAKPQTELGDAVAHLIESTGDIRADL